MRTIEEVGKSIDAAKSADESRISELERIVAEKDARIAVLELALLKCTGYCLIYAECTHPVEYWIAEAKKQLEEK